MAGYSVERRSSYETGDKSLYHIRSAVRQIRRVNKLIKYCRRQTVTGLSKCMKHEDTHG